MGVGAFRFLDDRLRAQPSMGSWDGQGESAFSACRRTSALEKGRPRPGRPPSPPSPRRRSAASRRRRTPAPRRAGARSAVAAGRPLEREAPARRVGSEVEHAHAPVGLPRLEGRERRLDGEAARPADLDGPAARRRAPRPTHRPRPSTPRAPSRVAATSRAPGGRSGRTSTESRPARGSSRSERRPGPCSIATSSRAGPTRRPRTRTSSHCGGSCGARRARPAGASGSQPSRP